MARRRAGRPRPGGVRVAGGPARPGGGAAAGPGGGRVGGPGGRAWVVGAWQWAPLVGAAGLPRARGRGVYSALLAARVDLAAAARCHTAISKARRAQSLPVLLREGFVPIGNERAH